MSQILKSYPSSILFFANFLLLVFFAEASEAVKIKSIDQVPVDVSFVIVDLKYNSLREAQICEIQHGIFSAFKGHAMWYEGKEGIAAKLVDTLNGFFNKSWVVINSFADPTMKAIFQNDRHWTKMFSHKDFEVNEEFKTYANLLVKDPTDLKAYHGFAFLSPLAKMDRSAFQNRYPGVVLIDNAFCGYASDKIKMTKLLMEHPLTEKHKPKWGVYNKNDRDLASRIHNDIGSDLLVIKPADESRGTGVIIIKKEELETVLDDLFNLNNLKFSDDPAYRYWKFSKADEFIVEEFIEVDPVFVPHLDNKLFSPTLRLAFLLYYSKQEITIDCLGGYYTLPKVAINDPGTINERYKSYVNLPYFAKADPEIKERAEMQIKEVLKIIYQQLLYRKTHE